ncbi:MAG: hypothetical protein Q9191_001369 [Dirinaria sp. TL-2023a]
MSIHSLPTLGRISRERLSSLILSPTTAPSVAIIDVRDSDHVGGHIYSSTHVPSSSLDYRTPELVRKLADKQIVVFHCALSQQRGPSAALRYLRERESKGLATNDMSAASPAGDDEGGKVEGAREDIVKNVGAEGDEQGDRETAILKDAFPRLGPRHRETQEVYVLDGGFVKWQEM